MKATSENRHLNLAFKMRGSQPGKLGGGYSKQRKSVKAGKAGVGAIVQRPEVQFGRTCMDRFM